MKEAGITHVVSVLRLPLDKTLFKDYEHKVIEVDDVSDENMLEHFTASNEFISGALQAGGAVLIHWFVTNLIILPLASLLTASYISVMGKSRSATILAAYLMASRHIPPNLAVGLIERARPIAEPNLGFMRQLELYHKMEYTAFVEDHPIYQRWIYMQDVKMSNAAGRAPERVHFRDAEAEIGEITQGMTFAERAEMELRCKRCRYVYFCAQSDT